VDRVRGRVAWVGRALLLALAIYFAGGIILGSLIFGTGGGSPGTAQTVYAIAFGVVSLTAAVLLSAHDIRFSDLNWTYEDWTLRRPTLAIAVTSFAVGVFFVSLERDLSAAPAGVGLGIIFGSIALRRTRERRGVPPPAATDTGLETRVENWRLRRPIASSAIVVVACFGVLSLADRGLITVPANVVVSLVLGWFNLHHARKLGDPQGPPPLQ
jgi:hypothetical protein